MDLHTPRRRGLTGLMNAGAFHLECEPAVRLSQRNRSPLAVLFIDQDHFKQVNDTHGHAAGAEVLLPAAAADQRRWRPYLLRSHEGVAAGCGWPCLAHAGAASLQRHRRAGHAGFPSLIHKPCHSLHPLYPG
ncbi:GGDEF domain-containing protein [Xylophilus sp. ASV27]|uniref:GGDEF domain-containing protein n=1 Tax=Xylophilus sp. ASV27 TaxID=2795129 RepID=UPI00351C44C3